MVKRTSFFGVLGLLVVACSGADDGSGVRSPGSVNTPGGNTGGAVSTGGSDSAGTGGFSSQPPPSTPQTPMATGGAPMMEEMDCTTTRCDSDKLDETDCGFQEVKGDVKVVEKPGNVLMVYDRSGSMEQDWNGEKKYEAAGNAIIAGIEPLKDLLTVGAVFFPSIDASASSCTCNPADFTHWIPGPDACCLNGAGPSCFVGDIKQPDQIDFRPGPAFIDELPNQWRLQGAANTPLQDGLIQAEAAISSTTFEGSLSIVVVTDGQPNCGTDQQAVLARVAAWSQAGYKTYVVGLPGAQGAAELLNEMAVAGGTDMYIDPGSPENLEMRLRDIVQDTIGGGVDSCTINLTPPAEAPEKLRLVVNKNGVEQGVGRMLSDEAGWNVSADGAVVTLEGLLCDEALAGVYQSLRFDFGCVELPPLPPPEPPVLE